MSTPRPWRSTPSGTAGVKATATVNISLSTTETALIGHIELDHIAWRSGDAELRIRIGEKDYWDQGYGTRRGAHPRRHAFGSMRLSRVYLRVFSLNKRAIRCYEKVGFRKEGRIRPAGSDGRADHHPLDAAS